MLLGSPECPTDPGSLHRGPASQHSTAIATGKIKKHNHGTSNFITQLICSGRILMEMAKYVIIIYSKLDYKSYLSCLQNLPWEFISCLINMELCVLISEMFMVKSERGVWLCCGNYLGEEEDPSRDEDIERNIVVLEPNASIGNHTS
jgi:hypothetical protein